MFGFKPFWRRKNADPDPKAEGEASASGSRSHRATAESSSSSGLRQSIIAAIRTIYDPEIPVNIYDLGLIYSLQIDRTGAVQVQMTLTAPACPVAGSLPAEVERTIQQVPGVDSVQVELVWDPPWSAQRMSEAARLELGIL